MLNFRHFLLASLVILLGLHVSAQNNRQYQKDPASGFPGGYVERQKCVSLQDVAGFETAFLRADMAPNIKAELTKAITESRVLRIVNDSEQADFLIDISERPGRATLRLWAMASRPNGISEGIRCNIMPNEKRTAKIVIDEMIEYLKATRIAAGIEKDKEAAKDDDGFPDSNGKPKPKPSSNNAKAIKKDPLSGFPDESSEGRYDSSFSCGGIVTEADLRNFSKVFIADNVPADVKGRVAKALNDSGIVTVVNDSLEADYLILFESGIGTTSETKTTPMVVGDDGVISGGENRTSTMKYEISSVVISAIKHPASRGARGTMCILSTSRASRPKGLLGKALVKNPEKKVIQDILKFFSKYSPKK